MHILPECKQKEHLMAGIRKELAEMQEEEMRAGWLSRFLNLCPEDMVVVLANGETFKLKHINEVDGVIVIGEQ